MNSRGDIMSSEQTSLFDIEKLDAEVVRETISSVYKSLEERGYNAVNQISGYLISNDPAYISSHKNARNDIQHVERYEIIEELVRYYLECK